MRTKEVSIIFICVELVDSLIRNCKELNFMKNIKLTEADKMEKST